MHQNMSFLDKNNKFRTQLAAPLHIDFASKISEIFLWPGHPGPRVWHPVNHSMPRCRDPLPPIFSSILRACNSLQFYLYKCLHSRVDIKRSEQQ